jgi:hypothetical protein
MFINNGTDRQGFEYDNPQLYKRAYVRDRSVWTMPFQACILKALAYQCQ